MFKGLGSAGVVCHAGIKMLLCSGSVLQSGNVCALPSEYTCFQGGFMSYPALAPAFVLSGQTFACCNSAKATPSGLGTGLFKLLALLGLLLALTACAARNTPSGQPYVLHGNHIAVNSGPDIRISPEYVYAGAEIIPSLYGADLKRQIFAGPDSSFLTVSVFDTSSEAVRRTVSAPANPQREFLIRADPPRLRITGNKTPCCVNLLRSEYIFLPAAGPLPETGAATGEAAPADLPGRLIVISYGIPIPEALLTGAWTMNPEIAFLQADEEYTPDGPSPAQAAFLAEQERRARGACRIE